ncbi:fibronectin type III domain-containing protein [Microbulbifer variabilis]|uniref:Fibronectin type III domain-containing protein n=1 Tax=Microbulbifer variabilis TaxID=266805 RepID=A0ABY4V9S3_9GAMM|nr:fibronectin type III domain-containing protein [Microbulbifer variabilis]USD21031.1 fibronectin type III domain-containing protein [Microbulbifer variabilis]
MGVYLKEYKNGTFTRNIPLDYGFSSSNPTKSITVSSAGKYFYEYWHEHCTPDVISPDDWEDKVTSCPASRFNRVKLGTHTVNVIFQPAAPSSINYGTFDSDGAYKVSWSSSTGAGRYELYRRVNSGSWSRVYNGSKTSFDESGRSSGNYQYRVRACNTAKNLCGAYKNGGTIKVELTPSTPTSITVPSYTSSSSFSISWAASSGATRYEVQQRKDNGNWLGVYSGSSTSTTIASLSHGSTYRFRVRACNTTCSGYRESQNIEVYFRPGVPTPKLNTTTSLDGKYTVSWNTKQFATSYQLVDGSGSTLYNGSGLSKSFSGVSNGSYSYKVRACNAKGTCSNYSSLVTVKVDRAVGVPVASASPTNSWDGKVKLSWSEVKKGGLTVEYQVVDSANKQLYRGTARSYQLSNLQDGRHCYRVRALTSTDQSNYSPEACATVALLKPPVAPSYITVPSSTGEAYTVSWPSVDKADSYLLQQRMNNGSWKTVYNGAGNSYKYNASPLVFGTHDYRVQAANKAGSSDFSNTFTVTMELDPTVQIRKQLYYNEADQVPAAQENPAQGIFSRDRAAFRYLDLMYIVDTNTNTVINPYASGEATVEFSSLYDTAERNRATEVEAFIFEQLTHHPNNENLQRFTLDVYYDRAVAEMILANEALDNARISRLRNEAVEVEVGHIETAHQLLKDALEQYNSLLTYAPEFLAQWGPSRGQISPRYYDPNDLAQKDVTPAELLFTGYKDVTMLYQLMSKLASTKVQQARLAVVAGQTNTTLLAQMVDEMNTLRSELIAKEQSLRAIFPNTDFTQVQGFSGLPEAVYAWQTHLSDLENSVSWLTGETNILGLPQDSVLLVQGYGIDGNTVFDSFNALSDFLGNDSSGPIATAQNSLAAAKTSYENYRHSADKLATEYTDRHQQLGNWLYSLLGLEFPSNCFSKDCIIVEESAQQGSEIALQANNIDIVQIALSNNLQRMEDLLSAIEIEIERRAEEEGIVDGMSKIILDYGSKQESISKQITKIRKEAEKSRKRDGFLKVVGGAIKAYYTGDTSTLEQGIDQVVSSHINLKSIKDIGKLEAMSIRLGAEERAKLNDSSNKLLDVESRARVRTMWLEANTIALDIAQAEATVEQEVERLVGMLNQAQRVMNQMFTTNANLAERYFADPIHASRLTTEMLRAERHFEEAQKWLFYAASALEYKWQESFVGSVTGSRKEDIFQVRNAQELRDFYSELLTFDQLHKLGSIEQATDTFSLKDDVFGYVDKINGISQTYAHPDPAQQDGPRLSPQQALQEKLRLLSRKYGSDTWVTVEFSTVKELPRSNFFLGPVIADNGDLSCLATGGNYLDKIETVGLNIPLAYSVSGETETPAFLTYGGTSFLRSKTPGTLVENADGVGIQDEFITHSTRFWDAVEGTGLAFRNSYRVSMSANLDVLNSGTGSNSTITSAFKERSVAATGWRLSLKLADRYGSLVDLNAVKDVELIFNHRFKPRNVDSCGGDDGTGPLLLLRKPVVH